MIFSSKKFILASAMLLCLVAGWAFGFAQGSSWHMTVNGDQTAIPVRIIKNMYFVALSDLAKVPGWNVTVDLSTRSIQLVTTGNRITNSTDSSVMRLTGTATTPPTHTMATTPSTSPSSTDGTPAIEVGNDNNSGPPDNVRMTVQAAITSLEELRKALADNVPADALKTKRDSTAGIVQQAQNLLWSLPRTRTLQADIQVALEDLQSQINLALAQPQATNGILPWTHPVTQTVLLKYPDLRPCHQVKGKADGLDVVCARKMMADLSNEDFNDVQRDLEQYR